ncbi:MAG: DUF2892 domain-containing protein [Verrucomicrobiales bacterium]|nr:DUF2892 domain-containing protein [Verrucomicrobiales bacterium]
MKNWTCNIGVSGRVFRGLMGAALLAAGLYLVLKTNSAFWGTGLCTIGCFAIFEAIFGWCALKAAGFKLPF